LQSGIDRLAEDHANARRLAEGLAERFPGSCNPEMVETNLFHVQVAAFGMSGNELAAYLANQGILVFAGDPRMRLATHCNVSTADIAAVLAVFDTLRNQRKSIHQAAGLPGEPIPAN
jgi:threonine aldolase